ncbi:MAG: sulfatase [Candidatus Hydrogenedentota bacterium]|nr:MAG: sulfatase [Candidatus Hydrogenedentota bacterium]
MKQEIRELYQSFIGGYLIGILMALTSVYEGIFLNESQFARFFFPDKFNIPRLNRMVFEGYFVLFGGFVSGCILLALCLTSLVAAYCLKIGGAKAKRVVYVSAALIFSLLVTYSGFTVTVRNDPSPKAVGISALLAISQLLIIAILAFTLSRIIRNKNNANSRVFNFFLGSVYFIQVHSYSVISLEAFEDYLESMVEYQIYPLGLVTLFFLAFVLWVVIRRYATGARRTSRPSARRFPGRFAVVAAHCLFLVVLLVWAVTGPIFGSLPVEDKIELSRTSSGSNGTAGPNRFNVVVLLVDMLRRDHLGCYGYERETSPFIDEMAREGIKFNNAFAPCSWTLPSVASVFTGLYPTMNGVRTEADALPSSWATMAEAFRENGYSTAAFITSPYLKKIYNLDQGFGWYDDRLLKRTFLHLAYESTSHLRIIPRSIYSTKRLLQVPVPTPDEEEFNRWWSKKLNAENVNERVLKWVEKNRRGPVFLYIHYIDVHGPYRDPHPYMKYPTTEEEAMVNLYDGAIRFVDEQIKRLMDALKELKVYDNSLIIFTSDHGQEFLDHNGTGHGGTLYEEQLRIPLIIFPSRIVPGQREIDAPVGLIDLFPTFDDWLSLGFPRDDLAVSLKNAILTSDDTEIRTRKLLFGETDLRDSIRCVLLENRWKYIESTAKGTQELYDLLEDPAEQENLLPEHSALSRNLKDTLDKEYATFQEKAAKASKVHLDEWTRQSLKAMGYLD